MRRNYRYGFSPSDLQLCAPVPRYPDYKAALRRAALRVAKVRRIHIIGTSRSGTTMLHYAMLAFAGTILHDEETDPEFAPALRESFALALPKLGTRAQLHYVTKRNSLWFASPSIVRLVQRIHYDGVGLIHIIRDPRDVLTSVHKNASGTDYYLDPMIWVRSICAADTLDKSACPVSHMLTLRYEDVVLRAEQSQMRVAKHFDLQLRPGVTSWANLRENLDKLRVTPAMETALHRLRDFDPASIGGWRRDERKRAYVKELLADASIGPKLREILARHRYVD